MICHTVDICAKTSPNLNSYIVVFSPHFVRPVAKRLLRAKESGFTCIVGELCLRREFNVIDFHFSLSFLFLQSLRLPFAAIRLLDTELIVWVRLLSILFYPQGVFPLFITSILYPFVLLLSIVF